MIFRFLSFYLLLYIAREIIIMIVSSSHCTFLHQTFPPEWTKILKILKSKNRRISTHDETRKGLLYRPRMLPEENKRTRSARMFPSTAHPFLLHLIPGCHFISSIHIFFTLVLCFYLSQSLFTVPLIQFPGFTKEAFLCCAAFRQSTGDVYVIKPLSWSLVPLRASHAAGHVSSFILCRDTCAIYATNIYRYDRYRDR